MRFEGVAVASAMLNRLMMKAANHMIYTQHNLRDVVGMIFVWYKGLMKVSSVLWMSPSMLRDQDR